MSDTSARGLAYPFLCGLLAVKPTKLSQAMHNAGFKSLGIDFSYVAFDVLDTAQALAAARVLGVRGLSLTIPHKENALELVDSMSEEAKEIGAINTVLNDGVKWHGENTDWYGINQALAEANIKVDGHRALVLGAGGAARAGIYALKRLGAKEICVFNRTQERAKAIAKEFSVGVQELSDGSRLEGLGFDLVVNATPIGSVLASDRSHPFVLDHWPAEIAVFDMVTKTTELIKAARDAGARVTEGPRMLLHQAVKQFELFSGEKAPIDVMEQALLAQLAASG